MRMIMIAFVLEVDMKSCLAGTGVARGVIMGEVLRVELAVASALNVSGTHSRTLRKRMWCMSGTKQRARLERLPIQEIGVDNLLINGFENRLAALRRTPVFLNEFARARDT